MPQDDHIGEAPRERYAFIDVYNTEKTAELLLGFKVDWIKVYEYLTETWKCKKVFFYVGTSVDNKEEQIEHENLKKLGYILRKKNTTIFKRPDKIVQLECPKCGYLVRRAVEMGYQIKANCDVELTVDMMENASSSAELLIFTGDGDFEFVILNALAKGSKVYVVSSSGKSRTGAYRLALSLKKLIHSRKVGLIDLNSFKMKISR